MYMYVDEMLSNLELIEEKYDFIEKIEYISLSHDLVVIEVYIKKENYILLKLLDCNFKNKIKDKILDIMQPLIHSVNYFIEFSITSTIII